MVSIGWLLALVNMPIGRARGKNLGHLYLFAVIWNHFYLSISYYLRQHLLCDFRPWGSLPQGGDRDLVLFEKGGKHASQNTYPSW